MVQENGSGKSSILKYINMELQKNYNEIEPTLPLLIKINDKIEQMVDSTFFKEKLEKDISYILSKSNLSSKKEQTENKNDANIDKVSIFSFSSIEKASSKIH